MKRFDYIKYDTISIGKQAVLKAKFEEIEALVNQTLPPGRPQSLCLTALEEAYMWTGKGIRDEQVQLRGGEEQPERNNE